MNSIIERLMGVDALTDQVIAFDLLNAAKAGIRNYAVVITETYIPEIKTVLHKQLQEAIYTHEQILQYLMDKGFYQPYDMNEQIKQDMNQIETALNIPS